MYYSHMERLYNDWSKTHNDDASVEGVIWTGTSMSSKATDVYALILYYFCDLMSIFVRKCPYGNSA